MGTSEEISQILQFWQRQPARASASMVAIGAPAQKEWKASPQSTQNRKESAAPLEPHVKQHSWKEQ